ncbi:hypothetical protein C8Q74DRAFT_145267 [Fomes fomentarius]|nr:hypothetical protein C8Q74DRAFT_145267 [Fomes fomentarius]
MHSQSGHSRSSPYDYPKLEDTSYDPKRSPPSTYYGSMPLSPYHYHYPDTSMVPPSYPSGYSSYGLPASDSAGLHPVPTASGSKVRCEWGSRPCMATLEDSSPAGIARHLQQYHDVHVTDNRNRGVCLWGGRCSTHPFPSNFGKHIADCHLRNMTKQCPHCGADFARADTLSRHIKASCPNTTTHAGHSYSSSRS